MYMKVCLFVLLSQINRARARTELVGGPESDIGHFLCRILGKYLIKTVVNASRATATAGT